MYTEISISYRCYSFKLFIHQNILNKYINFHKYIIIIIIIIIILQK